MVTLFRYSIAFLCLLCMFSSVLTGIKYEPKSYGDKSIYIGYYESFIYIIICIIVLTICFIGSFYIKLNTKNSNQRYALYVCIVSLWLLGISLIYCDVYALQNNHNYSWGESALIWFIASIPTTVAFVLGILVLIYNSSKERK
jgi:cytochrome bd-type quinol oxidase subunit 2